ncbi:MAG: hypothetical protein M1814_004960 [Vezdaea aestivalis]|nr:MAG: hypothetical protein M1814_004960 [Vezdaea aestivalis]
MSEQAQPECKGWTPPPNGHPCWLELPSTDLERAITFYSSVFGWKADGEPKTDDDDELSEPVTMQMYNFPKVKGSPFTGGGISLVKKTISADMKIDPTSVPVVYLWCTDVDATLAAVVKAGGSVATPKVTQGAVGFYARFADTEGNILGIYAMKPEALPTPAAGAE